MVSTRIAELAEEHGRIALEPGILDGNPFTIVAAVGLRARRQRWPEAAVEELEQALWTMRSYDELGQALEVLCVAPARDRDAVDSPLGSTAG